MNDPEIVIMIMIVMSLYDMAGRRIGFLESSTKHGKVLEIA